MHDWKSCGPQKGPAGSNPALSVFSTASTPSDCLPRPDEENGNLVNDAVKSRHFPICRTGHFVSTFGTAECLNGIE